MLILSVGMPRAGSGWYYNLMHDLVVAGGGQDARRIRQRFHLDGILTEVNCNIGALTLRRLLAVLLPSLLGNTYVIKAHAGPKPFALMLIQLKLLRATYIYRDPRDALLSAFENGQRALQAGRTNAFSSLTDFAAALDFMRGYMEIWKAWVACKGVMLARYEDLLENYDVEVQRLLTFLDLDGTLPGVQAVIEQYRPAQARASAQQGLHFRKGKIGRFRQVMTPEQQQACQQAFGLYLEKMGYEV